MYARNQNPEVKVLKRYSVPKYPSYQDPDPTLYPIPTPYPFRSGAVSALAVLGLAGSTLSLYAKDGTTPGNLSENPLRLESSGLPHHTSPFGTGAPSYIQDKVARKAIEKIFREEGVDLQKNYSYDKDGITFTADGYNEELQVGYFFGGWKTLDQDAIISWMTPKQGEILTKENIRQHLRSMSYSQNDELKAEVQKVASIEDEEELRKAYEHVVDKIGRTKLSLAEAKALEKRAEQGKDFIAVISQYDRRFISSRWGGHSAEELEAHMKLLESLDTVEEKEEAQRVFQEKIAEHGLKALEKAVRQYIRWARTQGVQ